MMKSSMCGLVACVVFGTSPLFAQGKETPAEQFKAMQAKLAEDALLQLRATDPATIAWGAHAAAEFRLVACIPELRAQLVAAATAEGDAWRYVALAVLDALIQTKAVVPGSELQPFVTGITTDSALLLFLPQATRNLPILLEAYRGCGRGGKTFLQCGDLLADERAPGFALELLREPMMVVLTIFDQGRSATAGRCGLGHFSGCVKLKPPPGFPPCIQYGSSSEARVASDWLVDAAGDLASEQFLTARTRWMRRLLGRDGEAVAFDLTPLANVEWAGLEALKAREQEERQRIVAMHRELVAACAKAKLITADEAAAIVPVLRVFWSDARKDQTVRISEEAH